MSSDLFIDFKKAFDTVKLWNYYGKKLCHYGMRGIANEWVITYLFSTRTICII